MEEQDSSPSIQIKLIQPSMATCQVFSFLRQKSKYCDVTLASMDGVLHRAHRVVLLANSGFFSRVLEELIDLAGEPVVYMRGVDSQDLRVVIDLLYTGRARVTTDRFEQIEHLVEELKMGSFELENRGLECSDCNENITPKPRGDAADQPVRMKSLMFAKDNISAEKVDFGLVGARKEVTGKKSTRKDSIGVAPAIKDAGSVVTARKDVRSLVTARKHHHHQFIFHTSRKL